jgi:hypothetical protein
MNKFLISSNLHLGKLAKVCVYHDNSGKGKNMDWFLEKVVVYDKVEKKR